MKRFSALLFARGRVPSRAKLREDDSGNLVVLFFELRGEVGKAFYIGATFDHVFDLSHSGGYLQLRFDVPPALCVFRSKEAILHTKLIA